MTNNIVTVNVSVTQAPTPSTLQRTGAAVSTGCTSLTTNSTQYMYSVSDLDDIILDNTWHDNASLTWDNSVVTCVTVDAHGMTPNTDIYLRIGSTVPLGYSERVLCHIVDAHTFTYPLVSNPGSCSNPGQWILAQAFTNSSHINELKAFNATFFAQGSEIGYYVLELGPIDATPAQTLLTSWISANPRTIYRYALFRSWADSGYTLAFLKQYTSNTAMTYFHMAVTDNNYGPYADGTLKCLLTIIEAPSIPSTEADVAASLYKALAYAPSSSKFVTPYAFSILFDVTQYPLLGMQSKFAEWKLAGVNWVGTGAEGGISNTILFWGTMMDGRDLTYWYSVDWMALNIDLDISNEIINGSNNPLNPLYYSQHGIDRLAARAQRTVNRGISYGLALPPCSVSAVSFSEYVNTNPGDYKLGIYNGLSVTYTPNRGFTQITFDVNVTDFPTQ
jgi:hypothetical protein